MLKYFLLGNLFSCALREHQLYDPAVVFSCPLNLSQVKVNLQQAGYSIAFADDQTVTTNFSPVKHESKQSLWGHSVLEQVQRRFSVFVMGESDVRFRVSYRYVNATSGAAIDELLEPNSGQLPRIDEARRIVCLGL